tara:strand:- start:579 stop:971 length:393 start_codon:yes stop_codon:yes gene_type:complete
VQVDADLDEDDKPFDFPPEPKTETLKMKIIAFFSHEPIWYWTYCRLEIFTVLFFIVATGVFIWGKGANGEIAQHWRKDSVKLIASQCAHFGCIQEKSGALMQVSYDQYHYFASGRKNCLYLDFKIENIRR